MPLFVQQWWLGAGAQGLGPLHEGRTPGAEKLLCIDGQARNWVKL